MVGFGPKQQITGLDIFFFSVQLHGYFFLLAKKNPAHNIYCLVFDTKNGFFEFLFLKKKTPQLVCGIKKLRAKFLFFKKKTKKTHAIQKKGGSCHFLKNKMLARWDDKQHVQRKPNVRISPAMAFQCLLKLHPKLLYNGGNDEDTLLHAAVRNGDITMVEQLVPFYDDLVDFENLSGQSPLQLAIELRMYNAVNSIITHRRESIYQITTHGQSLLHLAVQAGDLEILSCLASVAPWHVLEKQDQWNNTALALAIKKKSLSMVEVLVQASPALVDITDDYGETPVICAMSCSSSILTYLLHACPHVINHKSRIDKKNLLHLTSNVDMARKLLDIDPNLINETTSYGKCALHHAVSDDVRMLELLLPLKPSLLLHRDHLNVSPLHFASKHCTDNAVNTILTFQPDLVDTYNGNTVLHAAVKAGNSEVIASVFSNRISNVWCENNEQRTPLWFAVHRNNKFAVRLFAPHVLLHDALDQRQSSFGDYLHARCVKECSAVNNYILSELSQIVFEYLGLITKKRKIC